jgi:hypothetical protein
MMRRVNLPLVLVSVAVVFLAAASLTAARVSAAGLLVVAALLVALGLLVVTRVQTAFAEPTTTEAAAFGHSYGTDLSPAGIALVSAYLRRVRRYRAVGAWAIGPATLALLIARRNETSSRISFTFIIAVGFCGSFVGAVLAEAYNVRRGRYDGPRVAALDARDLATYLPGRERVRVIAAALLVVGIAVANVAAGWISTASVLVTAGSALVILGVVEVLQHHVVNRPRPAMAHDLVEADDAIRLAAVRHGLSAPGFCLELLVLSTALVPVVRHWAPMALLSIGAIVAALVVWFRVPRFLAGERLPAPVAS